MKIIKSFRYWLSRKIWNKPVLYGSFEIQGYEKQCSIGFERKLNPRKIDNLIVDNGKITITKLLANVAGGGYFNAIGVGTGTSTPASSDTGLTGATWKTIDATNYVIFFQPKTLGLTVLFDYGDANFTWKEVGIRDNQGTPLLVARQLLTPNIVKSNLIRYTVTWNFVLNHVY